MIQLARTTVLAAMVALSTGCAVGVADLASDSDQSAVSSTDGITSRLDLLKLTLDADLQPVERDGRTIWTLRGKATRDVTDLFTFVPDDAFAAVTPLSPRTFEIAFETFELQTVLQGRPLFLRVRLANEAQPYFASIAVQPRYSGFAGTSRVFVEADTTPIFFGGEVEYRGRVHLDFNAKAIDIWSDNDVGPSITRASARNWLFDFNQTNIVATANPSSNLVHFVGVSATDRQYAKTARTTMHVADLQLTAGDPYEVWPTVMCNQETLACLNALPFGTLDASACGTFAEVRSCPITKVIPLVDSSGTNDEIAALTAEANATLPSGTRVATAGYRYRWQGMLPGYEQVAAGLIRSENLEGAEVQGLVTEAELATALTAVHLEGFVDAARRFAFNQGLQIVKIELATPAGTGLSSGNATMYAVLYPLGTEVLTVELASTN